LNHFQGNDSSDEEDLPVVPDDQYDTEDSFIDDAELVGVFVYCCCLLWFDLCLLRGALLFYIMDFHTHTHTYIFQLSFLQDEYFEVDNSAIKHDGFFVNRGKLERM
jgi:hypothetical protein